MKTTVSILTAFLALLALPFLPDIFPFLVRVSLESRAVLSVGMLFGFCAVNSQPELWLKQKVGRYYLRQYGPGKFSFIIDQWMYETTLHGGADEETSYPDGGEWFGMVTTPSEGGSLFYRDSILPDLTYDEIAYLDEQVGAILYENSDGFVSVKYFDNTDLLRHDWNTVLADVE